MIRYSLACEAGHGFESWFPSSESFDDQSDRGFVTCPLCGSARVAKTMMAPSIGRALASPPQEAGVPAAPSQPESVSLIAEPDQRRRAMLKAFREHVVANSDDVGRRFPDEARRIHYGEADERAIHGEASPAEARALIEEGIAVAPLPPMPEERN